MTSQPDAARPALRGLRILVADDEILIAFDISETLSEAGAEVVGPCVTLADTLRLCATEPLSAAMLDIRLGRATTEPAAQILCDRGIPFLFYSGQELPEHIKGQWPDVAIISKPAAPSALVRALANLVQSARAGTEKPVV